MAGVGSSKGLRLLPSALWALAAEGTGVGSTRHVTRCGIGIRGHGEEEPFSLWFCPVRELMLSAGLLFRLRFSWSASLVKLGFFAFLQFRQLPLQIGALPTRFEGIANKEENGMPTIAGFDQLASVAEEQITDKIGRRVISGKQGTMVYWRMKAGAHAASHQHPQEQFVWLIKGAIRLRIGAEERAVNPGDIAVIPGGVESTKPSFPKIRRVIDFFAPVRARTFSTSEVPSYMAQRAERDTGARCPTSVLLPSGSACWPSISSPWRRCCLGRPGRSRCRCFGPISSSSRSCA